MKKKAKKSSPKLSQREQSRRFTTLAKEAEADESGGFFERAFAKLVPTAKARKHKA